MANKVLIELIKKHALLNYEKSYGWSEVVECYSDEDIADIIGDAATSDEAIDRMEQVVGIRDERYREAIGPDIECPECGTVFGENTACPNWANHPSERDDASMKMERLHDNEHGGDY